MTITESVPDSRSLFENFQAVNTRQPDIEQDQVGRCATDRLDRFFTAGDAAYLVTLVLEDPGQRCANVALIVDHQNARRAAQQGISTVKTVPRGCRSLTRT